MNEIIDKLMELNEIYRVNAKKYVEGNKAAGLRARKAAAEAAKLYREFRKQSILADKKKDA